MSFYIAEPNTPSPAVNALLTKLNKERRPPKVNLPAIARRDEPFMECWEADPGKVFISSDFTSLEPSITAQFSKDPNYKYATYDGIGKLPQIIDGVLKIDDIYLMTASVLPGIREPVLEFFSKHENCLKWLEDSEWCKEHPLLKKPRKKAKPAVLGFNYGMGPKRFVKQCYDAGITITLADAKAMHKAFWKLFAGVQTLTKRLEFIAKRDKFIVNPFGYRLTTEPHKGYNAFIQSSASGVVDVLAMKFFSECPYAEFKCLVHDEVMYQIPEATIDDAKRIQDLCVESLNEDLQFDIPMRLGFIPAKTFAEIK